MDSHTVGIEILFILVLIVANGIFAMTEIAIVSSKKTRLKKYIDEGNAGAKIALELAENPNQLLSTVQVGITLIGIFTGAFGGATLSGMLAHYLKSVPWLAQFSDAVSLTIVVSIITYLSLVIGELVPKRVALNNPEPIAVRIAGPMQSFSRMTAPVVRFLSYSTDTVLKLLRVKPTDEPPVTEEEIKIMIEQGTEAGTLDKAEQIMVDRVFRFGDLKAGAILTPRTQMVWLDLDDPVEENLKLIRESDHSSFPAARESLDNVIGMVYTRDLVMSGVENGGAALTDFVREALFIPKNMRAMEILELFKNSGTHEALVMDEYGGTLGLITLHDVLEQIVGEIPTNKEEYEPEAVQRADGSWLLDGMLNIDELKEILDINTLPKAGTYHTLGGFVVTFLDHIPSTAERFVWDGWSFEIVDMDRTRVDKVLVTSINTSPEK